MQLSTRGRPSNDEFQKSIFCPETDGQNDAMASSPIVITLHAVYPKYNLTMRSIFGWLLCPPIQQKPSKSEAPAPSLFKYFFVAPFATQNDDQTSAPMRSSRANILSTAPPHRRHHRSVGCCVDPLSKGHPRPVLRPSLNFLMGAILAPQTRGLNAARASPNAGGLQKTHREPWRCDSGPWRILPWRGRE